MTFYSISNEEVWREVQELREDIRKAQGDIAYLSEHGADREKRVRKLEFRYYAVLAAIGTATVVSALVQRLI